MKRTIFSLALSAVALMAGAAPRTGAQAIALAQRFVQQSPAFRAVNQAQFSLSPLATASMRRVKAATPGSTPALYVVNVADDGFVVVSGDDRFREILGYCTTDSYAPDAVVPDGLQYWLGFLASEMQAAMENGYQGAPTAEANTYTTSVEPLVTTRWNQTKPYNNMIPNYATGCVATGMAQVMNYWKYPTHGIGSHTNSYFPAYSADFAATTYDWANMKDEYGGKFDTKAQVDAVATLMLHLGIATDMRWTADNSGTPNMYAGYVLINNFGYNPNLYAEGRDYLSLGAWKALLLDQLYSGHPLCYAGMTNDHSGAGHFFVLDGYDASTGKFHFNWGWGGAFDGYFDITALEPGGAGQAGALTGSYNYYQQAFINVQPSLAGDYVAHFDARQVFPINATCSKGDVRFRTLQLSNNSLNFKGTIGVAVYDGEGSLVLYAPSDEKFPGMLNIGSAYDMEHDVEVNLSTLADGQYVACVATQHIDHADTPYPVRAYYGNPTYYNMTVSGGTVNLSAQGDNYYVVDDAAPVVVGSPEENTLYENVNARFLVTVRNTGTGIFSDEVGVCIQKGSRDSGRQYITVPCTLLPGQQQTVTVVGRVLRTPGDYNLIACYGDNGDYMVLENKLPVTIKDEASAIKSASATGTSAKTLYNLQGVRVSNTDAHGIYIVNGKKILK